MYIPGQPPDIQSLDIEELRDVVATLWDELERISDFLQAPEFQVIRLSTNHIEIDKLQEGDTFRADGTDWNPGSGEGVYTIFDDLSKNKL